MVAIYNLKELGDGLSFENLSQALVNFVRTSRTQHPPIEIVISAIELLGSLISDPIINENDILEEIRQKIQDDLNSYGAGRVALTLMCDPDLDPEVFMALLDFSIQLLNGGNKKVQLEFYQFFVNVANSEIFFEKIHKLFLSKIDKIAHGPSNENSRLPVYKSNKVEISDIMRLLQLFCENHFDKLQNYIRYQEKSRTSYDLILDTVLLLEILLKKKYLRTFPVISQCFDSLTEFIQGPCTKNQESIIDGKFLELASNLLSLDERSDKYKSLGSKYEKAFSMTESILSGNDENVEHIKGWMIAHLKYKCMITIHSLLEGRNDNYIVNRMIRAFNIELFKENLTNIYEGFIGYYGHPIYDFDIFNHHINNDDYEFGSGYNKQD